MYRTSQKATGKTYPNPLVGAVIVHNDVNIGEGFHQKKGEAHAEINAINSVENPNFYQSLPFMFHLNLVHILGKHRLVH